MRTLKIVVFALLVTALVIAYTGCSSEKTTDNPQDDEYSMKPLENEKGIFIGDWKTRTYHRPSCPHVKDIRSDNRVDFIGIRIARSAGYAPCPVCRPDNDE